MINEIQPKIKFQNIVQCPFNEQPGKIMKSKKKKKKSKFIKLFLGGVPLTEKKKPNWQLWGELMFLKITVLFSHKLKLL